MIQQNEQMIIARQSELPPEELWSWVTESDKTARWFGPFRFEGDRLFVTMIQEETQPEMEGRVLEHHRGERLTLKLGTDDSAWVIQLDVKPLASGSEISLSQDKTNSEQDPWIDAGWQFYLDCLLAATRDEPMPVFDDYAPVSEEVPQE